MSAIPFAVLTPVMCNCELVYFNNSISLEIINSSAIAGMPGKPNFVDRIPSFIKPKLPKLLSMGICITTPSKAFTYCKAFKNNNVD